VWNSLNIGNMRNVHTRAESVTRMGKNNSRTEGSDRKETA